MQHKIQFHSLEEWWQRLRNINTGGRHLRDIRQGTSIELYSLGCQKKSILWMRKWQAFFSILGEKESLVSSIDNFKISVLLNDRIYVPGLTFTIIPLQYTYTHKCVNLTKSSGLNQQTDWWVVWHTHTERQGPVYTDSIQIQSREDSTKLFVVDNPHRCFFTTFQEPEILNAESSVLHVSR